MRTRGKTVIIVTHDVEFVAECNPRVILMREGKIIIDGEARKVLTNPEILEEASIIPSQIAQVFLQLSEMGLPCNVIDVYEAKSILFSFLESHR
jgi:ABC-type cobalamin/Fe3+-siderophores transport system ATPase subunit